MKIGEYRGYEFHLPTSGGKAGKGHAKTSNIQVRKDSCILRQFRFRVDDPADRKRAADAAKKYVLELMITSSADDYLRTNREGN